MQNVDRQTIILFLHHKVGGWTWIWEWANHAAKEVGVTVIVVNTYPSFFINKVMNMAIANDIIFDELKGRYSSLRYIKCTGLYFSTITKIFFSTLAIKLSPKKVTSAFHIFGSPIGRIIASNVSLQFGTFDIDLRKVRLGHLVQMLFLFFNSQDKTQTLLHKFNAAETELIACNGRDLTSSAIYKVARDGNFQIRFLEINNSTDTLLIYEESPHSPKEIWRQLGMLSLTSKPHKVSETFFKTRFSQGIRAAVYSPLSSDPLTMRRLKDSLKGKNYVVFFTHSEHEVPIFKEFEDDSSDFKSQFDAIRAAYAICQDLDLHLVIRRHPNSIGLMDKKDREAHLWTAFWDCPQSTYLDPYAKVSSYELSQGSVASLTHSSTIGIETAFLGVPTRATGSAAWAFSEETRAWSIKGLRVFLENPTKFSNEVYHRWAERAMAQGVGFTMFTDRDGRRAVFNNLLIGA